MVDDEPQETGCADRNDLCILSVTYVTHSLYIVASMFNTLHACASQELYEQQSCIMVLIWIIVSKKGLPI